nr:MAG TPA: head closure knob [Caudoviricetes sp.]
MSAWDNYEKRITIHGPTKRSSAYKRECRFIDQKLKDNLSYQPVKIFPREFCFNVNTRPIRQHVEDRNVAIIDSDNLNEKVIYSMPSEDIQLGSLISWMDNYWIVTERDANTTLLTRAKLTQCNHLLRWITPSGIIVEQWCVVEDGTKYLTGELEDRKFIVTRGDARIAVLISKNKYTDLMDRESRFLIDDPDTEHKMSFQLTKPLKVGMSYGSDGVYKFVMQEVTATEYDDHVRGIADYYRYFPEDPDNPVAGEEPPKKGAWL